MDNLDTNVNLQAIVDQTAESTGNTKKVTEAVIRAALEAIKTSLVTTGKVSLSGFGSFTVNETAAREGRNPSTGEPLSIAASKRVSFKVAKSLKDAVKGTV